LAHHVGAPIGGPAYKGKELRTGIKGPQGFAGIAKTADGSVIAEDYHRGGLAGGFTDDLCAQGLPPGGRSGKLLGVGRRQKFEKDKKGKQKKTGPL